ncbi:hypothetical protein RhiirA4_411690 [Rhizophagus irregularis]|uniref:Uncharacterized protein n=1 Tax=Rhizophagus irregularis TaxID=588596 RepID=A0A2I1HEY3_9GLOM|nr:hypothetical protein RhiirA4_411690 [Rhizophagus irregularis]
MSGILWPLENSLKKAATKSWTGEMAWDVDKDGVIFEYTKAKHTTHDCKCTNDKKPWKLEKVYKEIPDKNKNKKKKSKKSKKSKKNSMIF